jgi:replication initiation factor
LTTTYSDRLRNATSARSSCDWASVTGKTRTSQEALWALGVRLLRLGADEGEEPTRWKGHGYDGWRTVGCAFGKRSDSVHLRLSSVQASQYWHHAVVAGEGCTRFDTALDLHFDAPVTGLARNSYLKSARHRVSNGRPPARRLIVSGDGGSTFYTGSRSSQRMGRLYDKGVESKSLPPGRWWRWEVEYKAESAAAAADAALRASDVDHWFASSTARFFRRRGAIAPERVDVSEIHNLVAEETSDVRLLSWLAVGVRPTVARLIERLGPERVTFSLGLPWRSAVSPADSTTIN